MIVSLISDIHANLPALEAVLADIAKRGDSSATYHLGDLVGYAPWPDETVALLRNAEIPGVAGNYDSTVGHGYKHCGCRYEDPRQEALSHESFSWTRARTSEGTKRFLAALPFRLDLRPGGGHLAGPVLVMVHGTPTLNTVYWTADRGDEFCRKMASFAGMKPGDTLAFGHTHLPFHRVVDGMHFVNAGSVGRPKDGDPRAGYVRVRIDERGMHVEFVRVEYDLERAKRAILKSTLPDEFAWYLQSAGQSLDPDPASAEPAR